MSEFRIKLLEFLIRLKMDDYANDKYRKDIEYLDQVLDNDKYIFMPIKKLNSATLTSEVTSFDKNRIKRRIRLTFTAELNCLNPEIFKEDFSEAYWKQVDIQLYQGLKEYLEQDG